MKVNEIFYSLQGEGRWSGRPAVFVRLSGCNLKCPFCDTEHQSFTSMSVTDILAEVKRFPASHIVITGGEPTLQLTPELVKAFKKEGYFVQIETNGSVALPGEITSSIDWITCSPKSAPVVLDRVDELKVVFQDKSRNMDVFEQMASEFGAVLFLQPCDSGDPIRNRIILEDTIRYIKEHPVWSLSLQTHKLINIQ